MSLYGLLIIDDSIEPKPHTKQNALINWHYDQLYRQKCVKGVNFISAFYYSQEIGFSVGVEYVKKDKLVINKKGHTISTRVKKQKM